MKLAWSICIGLMMVLMLALAQVRAGEIVVYEFRPGGQAGSEVLGHVKIKGLVAEFLDPADTGLGQSLGYLLWREVLTAISDQAGAGVILARPPKGERLTDLLKRDYHQAGLEIAQQQDARMLLWGAVNRSGDGVYLSSYMTLIPEIIGPDLAMTLDIEGNQFTAVNPRTRFNFAPIKLSRDALFRRTLVARARLTPRTEPDFDAPEASYREIIPKDAALAAEDMNGPWFEINLSDGTPGYVHQSWVAVPPRTIVADGTVRVRAGPGTDHDRQGVITVGQRFDVLDMRYRTGYGTWYQIERNGVKGWVASWVVRPQYSIPAVLFMAGLYRYQSDNFDEAVRSFDRFLRTTNTIESNVNLAAANQMLGAAQLANKKFRGRGEFDVETYLAPFDEAARLTPYDPAAYNLRALGRMASGSLPGAIDDLQQSLELDRLNPSSYELLENLTLMIAPDNPRYRVLRAYDFFQGADVMRIKSLNREFEGAQELLKSIR